MPHKDDLGPPGEVRAGATPDAEPNHTHQQPASQTGRDQSNPSFRQWRRGAAVGRYAHAWRDGFRRGAVDALRVAQREIDDPHMWLLLSRLADRYTVDPDDYDLCGGGR